MKCMVKNNSSLDLGSIMPLLKSFLPFAQERMGFNQAPSLEFLSDSENAELPLGKTAHYSPEDSKIVIFVDKRHPKDIMRSLSHELVHHNQNCNGKFSSDMEMGEGYAQNNEHLREMEKEAYLEGNMLLRDWEDEKKNTLQETIYYETFKGDTKMSINDIKRSRVNSMLMERWGYKKPLVEDEAVKAAPGSRKQIEDLRKHVKSFPPLKQAAVIKRATEENGLTWMSDKEYILNFGTPSSPGNTGKPHVRLNEAHDCDKVHKGQSHGAWKKSKNESLEEQGKKDWGQAAQDPNYALSQREELPPGHSYTGKPGTRHVVDPTYKKTTRTDMPPPPIEEEEQSASGGRAEREALRKSKRDKRRSETPVATTDAASGREKRLALRNLRKSKREIARRDEAADPVAAAAEAKAKAETEKALEDVKTVVASPVEPIEVPETVAEALLRKKIREVLRNSFNVKS